MVLELWIKSHLLINLSSVCTISSSKKLGICFRLTKLPWYVSHKTGTIRISALWAESHGPLPKHQAPQWITNISHWHKIILQLQFACYHLFGSSSGMVPSAASVAVSSALRSEDACSSWSLSDVTVASLFWATRRPLVLKKSKNNKYQCNCEHKEEGTNYLHKS